jgi:hypothetical protein
MHISLSLTKNKRKNDMLERKFKKKWLDVLRSDLYTQVKGRLGNGANGRCCLGVGADIAGVHSYVDKRQSHKGNLEFKARLYEDRKLTTSLDSDLKYDFPSTDMLRRMGGLGHQEAGNLAEMNDDGVSFGEIADYIEEKL